jgi:hypothetical protein
MTGLPEVAGPAPDLIDPIIGYRQWRLVGGALTSLFNDTRWEHPQISARCDSREHHPEVVPDHGCSCGIYAYYDPCPRTASAATRDLVGGAVIMWGRVELHGTGLRAENAQIVALELPLSLGHKRRSVLEVADGLGVGAVPHRRLRSVAREQGVPLDPSLRPPRVREPVVASWRWSLVS